MTEFPELQKTIVSHVEEIRRLKASNVQLLEALESLLLEFMPHVEDDYIAGDKARAAIKAAKEGAK